MNTSQLRISQYETVLFNANLNPKGIPNTVRNAIKENIDTIVKYPDIYYTKLKTAVSSYVDAPLDSIIMGNGSTDLLKLFATLIHPKKTMLISPGPSEYANVLSDHDTDIVYFDLGEEDDFTLDIHKLSAALTDDLDMLIVANPNNPTSKKISHADMKSLVEVCEDIARCISSSSITIWTSLQFRSLTNIATSLLSEVYLSSLQYQA